MQIASDTPQDKNLYKTDNALSEYNILQLSSELYFTVVKILKFPMCYADLACWRYLHKLIRHGRKGDDERSQGALEMEVFTRISRIRCL